VLLVTQTFALDLKVGGYVKLDSMCTNKIIDGGSNLSRFAGGPTYTPVDDDGANHGNFRMGAYESRIKVSGTEEVEGVKLKGLIEGDFYGSSSTFRFRHGYVEATLPSGFSLLAGQYWSNFQDLEIYYPETINFAGPTGQIFKRAAQLKLAYALPTQKLNMSVAAEGHDMGEELDFTHDQAIPFFTGKVVWSPGPVTAAVCGAVGSNRSTSGSDENRNTAWGVTAGVAVALGPVSLYGHVQRLDGLGASYGAWDYPDYGYVNPDQNVKSIGWYGGGSYTIGGTTFNAVFGQDRADSSAEDASGSGSDKLLQTFHVNVMQYVWKKARVGLEYSHAKRERFDGESGNYNRVQGAVWYYF